MRNYDFEDDIVEVFKANKPFFLKLDREDIKKLGMTAVGDRRRLETLKEKIKTEV